LANKKITELSSAGALSGAELVEAVQGGVNVKTTTQAIANLAASTPGAEAFLDLTDVPGSYSGEANKVVSVKADESGLEFTTPSGLSSVDGGTVPTEITAIQFYRGTAAAWTSNNPTLASGKPGFETDTGKLKIGDGTTAWTSLPYVGGYTFNNGVIKSGSTVRLGKETPGSGSISSTETYLDPDTDHTQYFFMGESIIWQGITLKANQFFLSNVRSFANAHSIAMSGYGGASTRTASFEIANNQGGISGPAIKMTDSGAVNNVVEILHLRRSVGNGSVASTAGVGQKINFQLKNGDTSGTYSPKAGLSYILTDVTNGSEDSKYILSVLVNGVETTVEEFAGTPTALVDASSMALTNADHTLSTSSATRTFTISYTGREITIEVTLNAVSSLFTFPATALCVSEGIASGDNTCPLAGVSGDKYLISIKKMGSAYYVACKNWGQ
jgi:hypothetical protein